MGKVCCLRYRKSVTSEFSSKDVTCDYSLRSLRLHDSPAFLTQSIGDYVPVEIWTLYVSLMLA